ncbi:MAG TPA: LuxR C-terminal-related transcriptional regulator [Mycobacteriales bacterium]|nr:LuxR C-terminal-related transcriptional regulator [Mycobacteriales bacterium]
MIVGRDADVAAVAAALTEPGLTVVAGGPGVGRSTVAYAAARRFGRPVHAGGGLITLRHVPYLPLSRAIRAPLPPDDRSLAVEAVRARAGGGLLLLDDLQWADHATLDLLEELAGYLPVLAAIRTPAPLTGPAFDRLRAASGLWLTLAPLDERDATAAARDLAPTLPEHLIAELVASADGNPAVLTVLARTAGAVNTEAMSPAGLPSIAALVAELPQDERTALAALGLLARPAAVALLGRGARTLVERGLLVHTDDATVAPRERIVAEVAAGVLPAEQRAAMHHRLAELVTDDGEAARHLAAAGEPAAAAERAAGAAAGASSLDARADYLALAAGQESTPTRMLIAARAALTAGRTSIAAELLGGDRSADAEHILLRARIALQNCDPVAARALLRGLGDQLEPPLRQEYAVARVRAETAVDPAAACALAEQAIAETGEPPAELLAAYGEAQRRAGRPDWETPLRKAVAAEDRAVALAAAATLVAGLREMLRTADAGTLAAELSQRCAQDAAYSWELNFTAELLWARLHRDGALDDVVAQGGRLSEHSMPAGAARLLAATVALARGDGGALAAARAGLHGSDRLTGWVGSELAWLDGDPAGAQLLAGTLLESGDTDLAGSLATLTAWWAGGTTPAESAPPGRAGMIAEPAAAALRAVQAGDFTAAAAIWDGVMLRERVRALLGAGETDRPEAVEALLLAEQLADEAGLAVLLGRVRRALRRHGVARRPPKPGEGGLSPREYEVMALVADGQSSRRIADRLGLTTNTVETYVRSAMVKLGAKTRTEAAVRAGELAPR